jgi:hypothetical protein
LIADIEMAKFANELILGINEQLANSLEKVEPRCSAEEFLNYKRAIGAIVYENIERILVPIYLRHPELKPPEMD